MRTASYTLRGGAYLLAAGALATLIVRNLADDKCAATEADGRQALTEYIRKNANGLRVAQPIGNISISDEPVSDNIKAEGGSGYSVQVERIEGHRTSTIAFVVRPCLRVSVAGI